MPSWRVLVAGERGSRAPARGADRSGSRWARQHGMRLRDSAGQRRYDHDVVPRGTASRGTTRYRVRLDVPRRSGWRAWGTARASFERALADPVDPAITEAEIAFEHRRGVDYVRVTVAVAVTAADLADALAIAWDTFCDAAADDRTAGR
jgi:hypothetical protein